MGLPFAFWNKHDIIQRKYQETYFIHTYKGGKMYLVKVTNDTYRHFFQGAVWFI